MSQHEKDHVQRRDDYNIPLLKAELGKIGYDEVKYFEEIPTTMDEARKLALIGAKQCVVLTDHQTKGVGRDGREWQDKKGSSVLVSTLFHIDESAACELSDLIALRLCETLRDVTNNEEIKIKTPNDIVANDKKLAGTLTQNIYDDVNRYNGTTVGIGVNVHYTQSELETFPTDYGAVSLDLLTGYFNERQPLLTDILAAIATIGPDAEIINRNQSVRDEYDGRWKRLSYMLNRSVQIYKDERVHMEGIVTDTGIGRGILVAAADGIIFPVSLFESNMKIRMSN